MPLINLHKLRLKTLKFLSRTTTKSKALTSVLTTLPIPLLRFLGLTSMRSSAVVGAGIKGKGSKERVGGKSKKEEEKEKVEQVGRRPEGIYHFLSDGICPICYSTSTVAMNTVLPTSIPNPSPNSLNSSSSNPTGVGASTSATGGSGGGGGMEDTTVKVPYTTNCGWECRYCYYCIVGKLVIAQEEEELDSWGCLRCGGMVTEVEREKDVEIVLP